MPCVVSFSLVLYRIDDRVLRAGFRFSRQRTAAPLSGTAALIVVAGRIRSSNLGRWCPPIVGRSRTPQDHENQTKRERHPPSTRAMAGVRLRPTVLVSSPAP